METYILKKSDRKNKRFVIIMKERNHQHHFGAIPFKNGTYIDHKDDKIKKAWEARHRVNKNWDNKHSSIYYSRMLLWTEPTLKEAIKKLQKKDKIRIKVEL